MSREGFRTERRGDGAPVADISRAFFNYGFFPLPGSEGEGFVQLPFSASFYLSRQDRVRECDDMQKAEEALRDLGAHHSPTVDHSRSVAKLATAIAEELECREQELKAINIAALLHDLGKFSFPARVLNSPARISGEDSWMVRCHPIWGYRLTEMMQISSEITQIISQHHENERGDGYPDKLSDKEICWGAKIVKVADTASVLVLGRNYAPAVSVERALRIILGSNPPQEPVFNRRVAVACQRVFQDGFQFDQQPIAWADLPKLKETSSPCSIIG